VTSWDAVLLEDQPPGSLVQIARERRLVLDDGHGPRYVDLCWVDEVALALIELARARNRSLTIAYPAPAGEVAVLLAAQLLIDHFVRGNRESSVGIVTADTTMAVRTWNALQIATTGAREPIANVFPSYRAGPEGESPVGGRRLRGVIIGQQCKGWSVADLVVDHLAGMVRVDARQPTLEVFANPSDPNLRDAENAGRLIWGWSEAGIAAANHMEVRADFTVPFSVAAERLDTIADGVNVHLLVARHLQAETAVARAREDLRLLRSMAPGRDDHNLERGLSAAWHHLTTLISLPCTPSHFDRFAGIPPRAVRPTRTFAPELAAWAGTLRGDLAEIAAILASDIADLRAALDLGNPFEEMLWDVHTAGPQTLVVTRTQTAARALSDVVAGAALPAGEPRPLTIRHIGSLHRQGTWPRAVMVGEPSPWDWHRLLTGIAPTVEVLVLGERSAAGAVVAVSAVRSAMDHWGGVPVRERTWRELVTTPPPPPPPSTAGARHPLAVVDGAEYCPEPDPFEALTSLLRLDPLELGGEGPSATLAYDDEGEGWTAAVPAVAVTTDRGRVLLEVGQPVDVRQGSRIVEQRPELLEPGAILLVGRRRGRVGLLDALEERLGHRPDLHTARFLLDRYRRKVRTRMAGSHMTVAALHRALVQLGSDKTSTAVRSWVTEGTMAPQQYADLERLNEGLELGMSEVELRELFAGVQRRRGFRRAAGRALAAAAPGSTVVADESQVDPETGLSIADLREAVVEAVVINVTPRTEPVPVTLLGRLEDL
jgi:hypothetical protein